MPCHRTNSSRIASVLWCRIISAYPEELAVQDLYFYTFQIKKKKIKTKTNLTAWLLRVRMTSDIWYGWQFTKPSLAHGQVTQQFYLGNLLQLPASPKRIDKVGSFWFIRGCTAQNCIHLLIHVHTQVMGTRKAVCVNLETNHQGSTLLPKGILRLPTLHKHCSSAVQDAGYKACPKRLSTLLEIIPTVLSCFR